MKKQWMWKMWKQKGAICLMACAWNVLSVLWGGQGLVAHEMRASVRFGEPSYEVKRIEELSQNDLDLFLSGQRVVQWNEGDTFPLFMDISGDFFTKKVAQEDIDTMTKPTLHVQVVGHFYMRCLNQDFLFSDDLEHWFSWEEFFTGQMGASMVVSDVTGSPEARLTLKLCRRLSTSTVK